MSAPSKMARAIAAKTPVAPLVARTLARLALTENRSLLEGAALLRRSSATYSAEEVQAGLQYARARLYAGATYRQLLETT